jgi:hypothetical protein
MPAAPSQSLGFEPARSGEERGQRAAPGCPSALLTPEVGLPAADRGLVENDSQAPAEPVGDQSRCLAVLVPEVSSIHPGSDASRELDLQRIGLT